MQRTDELPLIQTLVVKTSKKTMPFWLPGHSTCTHCGLVLREGDEVFQLPPAWLATWEPMINLRESSFHRECWMVWPNRERFVERVNSTASGYRFLEDGSWIFVGEQPRAEQSNPPEPAAGENSKGASSPPAR